jgi:hypothetical protein
VVGGHSSGWVDVCVCVCGVCACVRVCVCVCVDVYVCDDTASTRHPYALDIPSFFVQAAFQLLDTDNDGRVSFGDFHSMIAGKE